ncbi:MAG: serine hydrolase domain-containing protein [Bacteroidales bacterium]
MVRFFSFLMISVFVAGCATEVERFPGETWDKAEAPEDLGFNAEKLALARDYSETIATSAVMIISEGMIVDEWGETDTKYMTHSLRKSFLSALYGNYVADGTIPMGASMEELGIDDDPPLTEMERTATVRDLLKARSGIYHDALYESQGMKDLKPTGLIVTPGTHWYYNNWDFNASGTIFMQLTGKDIFEAIEEEIARPIGMEQFKAEDGWYVTGEASIHPAYPFAIDARDLARFGLLMLRNGRWKDRQIIPEEWVHESTRYHSDASLYSADGYGYMWWVARDFNSFPHYPGADIPDGAYSARGAGGHHLVIFPDDDLIIVHRVDTYNRENQVTNEEFGTLAKLILEARE